MVNPQVLNFFLAGAVILAVVAFRFLRTANPTFRFFGFGLAMYSAAFAVWTSIVALQPAELTTWTSVGVAFFGGAHFFYVAAAVSDFSKSVQRNLLVVAVVFLLGLFVLRTWILPSAPSFSPAGLFSFNAEAPVMLGYILVFAGSFMPAIHIVSSHIAQKNLAMFTRIFFNLTVLTAVVLLTSADETLQYWNGAVMALGLLGLLVNFVTTTPRYKTIA
jgi:hypothetical protein